MCRGIYGEKNIIIIIVCGVNTLLSKYIQSRQSGGIVPVVGSRAVQIRAAPTLKCLNQKLFLR